MRMPSFPDASATPAAELRPTPAERIRSVLAAAHSLTVVTDGLRTEVRHLDGTDPLSRIHLHPAGPGPAAGHGPAVRLEFTDLVPTPARDRVRARVTILGRLLTPYPEAPAAGTPDGDSPATCMEFAQAVLETPDGRSYTGLDELDAARPDPLAPHEAGMLTHLLDDHAELVTLLLRLVPPRPDTPALVRALPVALDRYGLTLRLEHRSGHRDVRLPFPSLLDDVEQSGAQMHALFSAARRRSHRNSLPA
ncbi:DUF2470 domain-containing protein [Streptomyces sp. NPDC006326]|uniref:DUF2470 domain-containing protein n=1 Tax=Streptomyces sp. NPDC006326 TaxID=3156752 RepID=UPI0033BEAEE1